MNRKMLSFIHQAFQKNKDQVDVTQTKLFKVYIATIGIKLVQK